MKLLPSEQKERLEEIPKLMEELEAEGKLYMNEPCNCGNNIQHNNGGNYHDEISYAFEDNKYFAKYDSTCELTDEAEWEETTKEQIVKDLECYLPLDYS